ncbi:GNAT family N-acetyltransferase [Azospirillum griseum]|uniref:N-acetyltransferase n=2 Tax=Azospirillum griseum TaxID=2496639 RepID=A0A3S0I2D0_9PROT|nr:GNAT family N-acetyltransferase [Azospirillum griseum]RTR22079.1 N-acetyltransferase [Azospirillum griseum]
MTLPVLHSDRLILRPRGVADLVAILAMDADPAVTRHVGGPPTDWAAHARSVADRLTARQPPGLGGWSFVERTDPARFLGWVSLTPYDGAVEIGWRQIPAVWGQGFATEAAARLLRHAFADLGLSRVVGIPPGSDALRVWNVFPMFCEMAR